MKKLSYTLKVLTLTSTLTLTGCSLEGTMIENDCKTENYETDDYKTESYKVENCAIVFIDGLPYLCSTPKNITPIEALYGFSLYDIATKEEIAKFSIINQMSYTNKKGDYITREALIPCTEITKYSTISEEMIDLFANDKEKAITYLKENIEYPVINFYKSIPSKNNAIELNLYTFYDDSNHTTTYHVAYDTTTDTDCNQIYDIIENRIYEKPNIGTTESISIATIHDKPTITANQAEKLLTEYISKSTNTIDKIYNKK